MPSTVYTSQTPLPLPHTEVVELVENDACIGMLAVFGYTLADASITSAHPPCTTKGLWRHDIVWPPELAQYLAEKRVDSVIPDNDHT